MLNNIRLVDKNLRMIDLTARDHLYKRDKPLEKRNMSHKEQYMLYKFHHVDIFQQGTELDSYFDREVVLQYKPYNFQWFPDKLNSHLYKVSKD